MGRKAENVQKKMLKELHEENYSSRPPSKKEMTRKGRLKTFAQNCRINITRKWFKFPQKSRKKAV